MAHSITNTELKELRNFGLLVGGVFLSIFGLLLPYFKHGTWNVTFITIGSMLILLGCLAPKSLHYPNRLWMQIGERLGFVNTRIILGIIYFAVFTPVGIIRRVLGARTFDPKRSPTEKSFRKLSEESEVSRMEKPF